MDDIIISNPELQTFKQRLGSAFLSLMSWMLWLYFLIPIFTLGGWFLGFKSLTDEIRWFGGYRTLLDLLLMYTEIICFIMLAWVLWTIWLAWFQKSFKGKSLPAVTEEDLAREFGIEGEILRGAKQSRKITVVFDESARIKQIKCRP